MLRPPSNDGGNRLAAKGSGSSDWEFCLKAKPEVQMAQTRREKDSGRRANHAAALVHGATHVLTLDQKDFSRIQQYGLMPILPSHV